MAGETYAQRRNAVLKQVRNLKRQLNNLNGNLEKARRESARLLDRKTMITPSSLERLNKMLDSIYDDTNASGVALKNLNITAGSYL